MTDCLTVFLAECMKQCLHEVPEHMTGRYKECGQPGLIGASMMTSSYVLVGF